MAATAQDADPLAASDLLVVIVGESDVLSTAITQLNMVSMTARYEPICMAFML